MRSSSESVLEYLILKVLASRENVVKALYDYFVDGTSPSSIATKYGLSKHQVRGYVQRIVEKTGSSMRSRVLMKYSVPVILKLKPITRRINDSVAICILCSEELLMQVVEEHIRKKHSDIVNECLNSVIDILRRNLTMKQRS